MTAARYRFRMLAVASAITLFTACASPQFDAGLAPTSNVAHTQTRSWMLPEAKNIDLMYVEGAQVYVYSYPKGKLEGTLDGVKWPRSGCVDKAGDVFIPDYAKQDIQEYRHGATTPFKTYDNSGYYPSDCSVDPKTGHLAVTNWTSSYGSFPGTITIFKPPQKEPQYHLEDDKIDKMASCTYDDNGNLYIVGWIASLARFGELGSGKHFILSLGLSPKLNNPGHAHWDGKHLVIANNQNELIRYAVSGNKGHKIGITKLSNAAGIDDYWIQPPHVLAQVSGQKDAFALWRYPDGGAPVRTLVGPYYAVPVVVSLANKSR